MQNGLPTFTITWQPGIGKNHQNGWLSSGVWDAIRLGLNKLPSIDPFDNIVPMADTAGSTTSLPNSAFGLLNEEKSVGYSREKTPDDNDDEKDDEHWESKGHFINLLLIFCLYLCFILI